MATTLTWLLAALAAAGQDEETKNLETATRAVREWDSKVWDAALAPDATLTLKITGVRDGAIMSANVGYKGRDDVKSALEALYKDYKPRTHITTRIIRGPDVVLMGDVSVTARDGERKTLPVAFHLKFDDEGRIKHMTLAAIAAQPPAAESR